jgi:hypothetical protein
VGTWRQLLDIQTAEAQERGHIHVVVVHGAVAHAALAEGLVVVGEVVGHDLIDVDFARHQKKLLRAALVGVGGNGRTAILGGGNEALQLLAENGPARLLDQLDHRHIGEQVSGGEELLFFLESVEGIGRIFAHGFVDGLLALELADFVAAYREVFQAVSDHHVAGANAAILADHRGVAAPALRRLADADEFGRKIGHG